MLNFYLTFFLEMSTLNSCEGVARLQDWLWLYWDNEERQNHDLKPCEICHLMFDAEYNWYIVCDECHPPFYICKACVTLDKTDKLLRISIHSDEQYSKFWHITKNMKHSMTIHNIEFVCDYERNGIFQ
jgi:hypothetical protein